MWRVAVAQPRDDLGVQDDRDAAWAVFASIAHNLVRWVRVFGLEAKGPLVAKTIRRKFIALPGRLTDSGRRRHLHLPTKWPWSTQWRECIASRQTTDLTTSASRSPAARPATSSANRLQTSPPDGLDASVTQMIDEGTAEDVPVTGFLAISILRINAAVD